MSLQREHWDGPFILECDSCHDTEELSDDFREAVQETKDLGWQIKKEGDDWVHYCVTCR